jgi:hypothetical protein
MLFKIVLPLFYHILQQPVNTCLIKEALEGSGDLKIGRKIINTVKYADDLVLLAKEEIVLKEMVDKIIEIEGCYGVEMNLEKTKVMRISRQQFPVKLMIDKKNSCRMWNLLNI